MYVRTIKVPSSNGSVNEYVRIVEAYRHNGKVKQRVIADLGRKDLLQELLPKLERVLRGTPLVAGEDIDVAILQTWTWGPVLVLRRPLRPIGTVADLGREPRPTPATRRCGPGPLRRSCLRAGGQSAHPTQQ